MKLSNVVIEALHLPVQQDKAQDELGFVQLKPWPQVSEDATGLEIINHLNKVDLKQIAIPLVGNQLNALHLEAFKGVLKQLPAALSQEVVKQLIQEAANTIARTKADPASHRQALYYNSLVVNGRVQSNEYPTPDFATRLVVNRLKLLLGFQDKVYPYCFPTAYSVPTEFTTALKETKKTLNPAWTGLHYQASSLIRMSGSVPEKGNIHYKAHFIDSTGTPVLEQPANLETFCKQGIVAISDTHSFLQFTNADTLLNFIPQEIQKTMTFIHAGDLDYEPQTSPWLNMIDGSLSQNGLSFETLNLHKKDHMSTLLKAMTFNFDGETHKVPLLKELEKITYLTENIGTRFLVGGNHDHFFEKLGNSNLSLFLKQFGISLIHPDTSFVVNRTLFIGNPLTSCKNLTKKQAVSSPNTAYQLPQEDAQIEMDNWIESQFKDAVEQAKSKQNADRVCLIMHSPSGTKNGQISYAESARLIAQDAGFKLDIIYGHAHQDIGSNTVLIELKDGVRALNAASINKVNQLNHDEVPLFVISQ